jgi:hypothetical protein
MLGSIPMKKILLVAAAAGLMSVAACSKSPEAASVENNTDMMADNMDAMSNTTANPFSEDNAEAVAENINSAADNVRDAGEDAAKNM